MEQFNAEDSDQWSVIKEYINSSDYYILIIGKRYGSLVPSGKDAGISYTEKEFNYAVSQGVPVLAFTKSDDATFRATSFDTDQERMKKLESFTNKVKDGRIVEWFSNGYELASKVTAALHNQMARGNRPGWVRGYQTGIEEKIDELIELLENANDTQSDVVPFDEDWDKPVTDYEFTSPRFPADGQHKELGHSGIPIGEGEYEDGKLIKGVEYDVLVRVTRGELIYKPDCPEDPYDSSEDFESEEIESYGWGLSFGAFGMSTDRIADDGMDRYYVVDVEVDGRAGQMINIRTLEDFLQEKDPKRLAFLRELIEMESA